MTVHSCYYAQTLQSQSSYSAWYFIESAHISDINANVTIALTSSILATRQDTNAQAAESGPTLFSRLIGAAGFQLINVNNVPLQLRGWNLDTRLLGRQALISSLFRHYRSQAISEAHKVGPFPWKKNKNRTDFRMVLY